MLLLVPGKQIIVLRYTFHLSGSLWTNLYEEHRVPLWTKLCEYLLGCLHNLSVKKLFQVAIRNSFRTTRGLKPLRQRSKNNCTILSSSTKRTRPVASCSGFRRLTQIYWYHYIYSTRKNVVATLHSMGCSRPSQSSYLVVDMLLLVLLRLRCKVPPKGTPICRGCLALVAKLGLPPWRIMDELDYYGSFVDFVDIV
jgi:hypothetical protein